MESLVSSLVLEYAEKLLAPESVRAQSAEITMTEQERLESIKKAEQLKPGDIILVKTPSTIYQYFRTLGGQHYDHIAVVLDGERSLHVSYPRAKLVHTHLFTFWKREPMVLRPRFEAKKNNVRISQKNKLVQESSQTNIQVVSYDQLERENLQKRIFLERLKRCVGKRYDYKRALQHFALQQELPIFTDKNKVGTRNKIVCSHAVYEALHESLPSFRQTVEGPLKSELELGLYGTFTMNDFLKIATGSSDIFETMKMYEKQTYQQPPLSSNSLIDQLTMFQSVTQKARDKMSQAAPEDLSYYQKFVQVRDKVVAVFTLYRLAKFLYGIYQIYKNLDKNKNSNKLKTLLKVVMDLSHAADLIQSGEITNACMTIVKVAFLLKPTSTGWSGKIENTVKFVSRVSDKVQGEFKL